MRIGFTSMNGPRDPRPDVLGRELEARAYDSLWYGEHPQIPVSRRTPYPAGGEMPDLYRWMMDPFLSLLLASTTTERLLLGTGVALPLEHDVFDLAKTVSTLDRLCGGRLLFGVGAGWNQEELANHRATVPWSNRYAALSECIGALRALWVDDESEYHGRYYDFDAVWSLPKPIQRPHPPILCGMGGPVGTGHAVAWADGWMPVDIALGDVAGKVARFREALVDARRDPGAVPITIVTFGDPTVAELSAHRELGIERVVIGAARTGWDDPGTVLPFLDRWAAVIPELTG